jgi:hypothetical protein
MVIESVTLPSRWTNSSCSAFPCISAVHGSITCYRWLSVSLSASCWAQLDSLLKISNIIVLSANLRMSTRQSLPRDLIHLPSCRSLQTECDDRVSSTSICWIFTSGRSFPGPHDQWRQWHRPSKYCWWLILNPPPIYLTRMMLVLWSTMTPRAVKWSDSMFTGSIDLWSNKCSVTTSSWVNTSKFNNTPYIKGGHWQSTLTDRRGRILPDLRYSLPQVTQWGLCCSFVTHHYKQFASFFRTDICKDGRSLLIRPIWQRN